jgi:uncharacterized membrane protein
MYPRRHAMPRLFSIRPGLTLKGRKFKGLRGWAGKPFHPPLTDVPIGAYTLAAAFDFISWLNGVDGVVAVGSFVSEIPDPGSWTFNLGGDLYKAATYCLIAGAIAAVPTALTGFWDWWKSTPKHTQAWRTANWHMAVMLTAQVLVIVLIIFRLSIDLQPHTPFGFLLFSVGIFALVAFGATYGGSLVYDYEFNVEQDNPEVWSPSETDKLPGAKDDPPTT